ncbi:MAG: ATP-binding protein [Wenzhouxiangellaceae bacterium]
MACRYPFNAWDSIFPNNMIAVAAVDRLARHADIIELTGGSYRNRAQTENK